VQLLIINRKDDGTFTITQPARAGNFPVSSFSNEPEINPIHPYFVRLPAAGRDEGTSASANWRSG